MRSTVDADHAAGCARASKPAHLTLVTEQSPLAPAVLGYFCRACGVMHADSPPIVTREALSVQQVRMIRAICELRATGDARTRELGLVEVCALLGIDWRRH
jgi:hypothetical protein